MSEDQAYREELMLGSRAGARYTIAMPRRVPMGVAGSRVGQRTGSSLEFRDHREYQPGDDLRRIDWSAMARTDRPHVKLYHEEVNPFLDVVLDGSASMALADTAKGGASVALAAALAVAARNAGATHRIILAGDGCREVRNDTADPLWWGGIGFESNLTLEGAFGRLPPRLRPRSMRVLISDLLFMGDPLSVLQPMARQAALVVVVQMLAEADAEPPHRGNVRLVDAESGELREVFVDAAAQKRYREALARHQENWSVAARQVGAVMVTIVAERLMATWDLKALIEADVLHAA